jgi:hypothetical protein
MYQETKMLVKKTINKLITQIITLLLCVSCFSATAATCGAKLEDWALNNAGITPPKPLILDSASIDTKAAAPYYNEQVRFRADVLRGDYVAAQAYWDNLASINDATERMRQIYALHFAISSKGLYYLNAAQAWLVAKPQSTAARLFYAQILSYGAAQARGNQYSSNTNLKAMGLFAQRFAASRPVLEEMSKRNDIYAWAAHIALKPLYFYAGEPDKGWASEEYLINQAPQYGWSYFWATEYTERQWAPLAESTKRLSQLTALASKHKLNELDAKVLSQSVDYVRKNTAQNSDPQSARPYWQKRVAEAPHLFNILKWLTYEVSMQNWEAVDLLATRAIALNPYQTYSFYQRSIARKETGNFEGAVKDTLPAAILGNDTAMSNLIQGYVRGTMGFKPGNYTQMMAYCKMGAAIGLPAAANCMGSAYSEAIANTPRDNLESASWHLLAARGGFGNSQHDFAITLTKLKNEQIAVEVSQHWMREAAQNGHVYAQNKASVEKQLPKGYDWKCTLNEVSSNVSQSLTDVIKK